MKRLEQRPAINYSGYRENQHPRYKTYPSKEEILEDLKLLEGEFYHLRIYDCSPHAYRVLELIDEHELDFKVMLGLSLAAEINHVDHPYFWVYPEERLAENVMDNEERIQEIIDLANRYEHIVSAVSIGNEIRSPWSNRRLAVDRMVEITKQIQADIKAPVTYCEEYQIWIADLAPLAAAVDFISLHTYPAWQGSPIEEALDVAVRNYQEVRDAYPDKPAIITETGWPTSSHGNKIKAEWANETNQRIYNAQISAWGKDNNVLVYLFEAFDEPWKGGNHPDEPEKHWGIYYVDRTRK